MKKLVVYLCASVLVLGLTACGGNDDVNNKETNQVETAEVTPAPGGEAQVDGAGDEEQVKAVDMSVVREAVVDVLGENYWPNTEIPAEFLEGHGLTAEMYEVFFGEMPMISTNVDTLIVIQAKDGQLDAVEQVLENYRESLVNDAMQYPVNRGKIQASRIESFGNCGCFVQLGADTTNIYGEDGNEEAVIKHCQEQNELALEAIGKVISQ